MNSLLTTRYREVVLPTADIALLFLGLLGLYRKKFKNTLIPREVSEIDVMRLVAAIWEQIVTERLLWMAGPIEADHAIDRVFPGYLDQQNCNRANSIRTEIIDPIIQKCQEIIDVHVPHYSWKMWTIQPYNDNGHLLEEGTDFRIYEWERMVKEKQISYPHIVTQDIEDVSSAMKQLGYHKIDPRGLTHAQVTKILKREKAPYG